MAESISGRASLERLTRLLEQESADGVALLRNIGENPICCVSYDASIPGLIVVWRGYATSTQLRFVHERILELLEEHGVAKILGDNSGLPTVHADDQKWIIENWIPRAKKAGLRVAAAKQPVSYFGRLAINTLNSAMPAGVVVRSFNQLDEARQWLESATI
jgi:hypothetical protein